MPDKAAQQLQRELASERERLATAIDDLRTEVDELKRKLPYVAAAVIATGIVVGLLRRRR
jgi:ElaB/YqjD/DUF883 family membrane-anchored ribosome-binding protein